MRGTPLERTSPGMWTNASVFLLSLVVLGALLVTSSGASEVLDAEKRALAPTPSFSTDALFDGSYTGSVEAFVADHFPFRDEFLAGSFWLRARRGIQNDTFAFYDVEVSEGGGPADDETPVDFEQTGGAAPEVDVETDRDDPNESSGDLYASNDDKGLAAVAEPGKAKSGEKVTTNRGVLIYRGEAMEGFGGTARGSRAWAESVNAYVTELGEKIAVYAIMVPSHAAFGLPEEFAKRSRPQKPNIDATYQFLGPSVHAVDAFGELQKHADEYTYFRTDHHWTGLGAYYAYRAFCAAAGFEPVPLDKMEKRTQQHWFGSLYWLTQDERLRARPDSVEHFIPPVKVRAERLPATGRGKGVAAPWFVEGPSGYGVFLGGDFPVIVAKTGIQNGRRAVLVKNSYGNAFAVLLASHFEEVIVVDYRYFTGSLVDLVREHGVSDVMVLSNVHAANTGYHIRRIKQILHARPIIRRTESPAKESNP